MTKDKIQYKIIDDMADLIPNIHNPNPTYCDLKKRITLINYARQFDIISSIKGTN